MIIVDAGGGTIDLSAFALGDADDEIKEIAPASCTLYLSFDIPSMRLFSGLFQGSIYVTRRAKKFLTCAYFWHLDYRAHYVIGTSAKLYKSIYGHEEEVQHMAECFDKAAKLSFKDPSQISLIRFGSIRDSDDSVDINFGQLKLQG